MKISFLLLIISSILFYGVVGKDKNWLLVPCFILNHLLVFLWILLRYLVSKKPKNSNIINHFYIPKDIFIWSIFFIFSIFLVFLSTIPYESKKEIFYLSGIFGAFIVLRSEIIKFKDKSMYFGIFLTIIMLIASYGIIIHFKCPENILWDIRYTDHYDGRLSSCYICPNHFAHLLQMLIPFCLCYLFIPKGSLYIKCICAYSLVIFFPSLFLTESRAGWLGAIASISVIICAFSLLKSKKLFFGVLFSIPILVSIIFILSWNYSDTFQRRMSPVLNYFEGQVSGGIGSDSKDFRPQTWKDTITMIDDRPLLGSGPGTYNYVFQKYRKSFQGERIITGHPHNEYLEIISDYGVVGFLLFSSAWIYFLFSLIKSSIYHDKIKYKYMSFAAISMMMGTMVHSFFDFQMHIYPNSLTFCFLLAVGCKIPKNKSNYFIIKKNNRSFFITLSLSFLMLILCIQSSLSSFFLSFSKFYFSDGASINKKSLYFSSKALKVDSKNWEALKEIGKIYYNKRYYSLQIDEKIKNANFELEVLNKAINLNPFDAEMYVNKAKALIFLGKNNNDNLKVTEGIENLRIACNLKKYNNIYSWILASELRKNNNFDESLKIFKGMKKNDLKSSIDANINWIENRLDVDKKNNFNQKLNVNSNLDKINIVDFLKEKLK